MSDEPEPEEEFATGIALRTPDGTAYAAVFARATTHADVLHIHGLPLTSAYESGFSTTHQKWVPPDFFVKQQKRLRAKRMIADQRADARHNAQRRFGLPRPPL